MTANIILMPVGDVERATGLARSTIYAKVKDGTFPKQVSLTRGRVGWVASEINNWLAEKIAARDTAA